MSIHASPSTWQTTIGEIRDFVSRNLINLNGLLHEDGSRSKAAFARHIGQLVLKPKQTPSGPIYEVSGGLNLLAGEDVMLVVARDGIAQHYTALTIPLTGICLDPALELR
jgi:hypothetical protein